MEDEGDLEFERTRSAVALTRKKHIDVTNIKVLAGIKEVVHQNSIFQIPKPTVDPKFRRECRQVTFLSSWVKSSSCSLGYVPILVKKSHSDDLRMRSVAAIAGSGPSVVVFDLELGQKLYEIEEHSSMVYSVMISRPSPDMNVMPIILTGSHNGFMKSWDMQSGNLIRIFGTRNMNDSEHSGDSKKKDLKIHSGPVKIVYVHENANSLAFSASGRELYIWKLEEGTLIKTIQDHMRPVSAICCYQHGEFSTKKRPASIVTGGEDSLVMIYSMDDFSRKHVLDNKAGPVNDVKLTLLNFDGGKEKLPIIVAACFEGSVQLWSLASGEWISCIDYCHGPVNAICVLPTQNPGLVSGHGDGTILISSLRSGEILSPLLKKNAETCLFQSPFGDIGRDKFGIACPVTSVSYTMFPRPIILGGYQDSHAYIWDLNIGETEEANALRLLLSTELLWKDPLLANESDSDEESAFGDDFEGV